MLFWAGGVGEVAVCCLSALSLETMEAPVRGKAGRCANATVYSPLFWLLWREQQQWQHMFQTQKTHLGDTE